jgi:hypothetical protein
MPESERDDSVDVDLALVQREGRGAAWPNEFWLDSIREDGSDVSESVCQKSLDRDEAEPGAEGKEEPGPSSEVCVADLDGKFAFAELKCSPPRRED